MRDRVIIVGAGRAGKDLHCAAFNAQPGVEVVAICDSNLDLAKSVAAERSIPHACASLEAALEQVQAEIVSICTPPANHLELARMAMDRGKAVLIEKPLTLSLAEAEELGRIQVERGTPFCAVHNVKFQAPVREAIEDFRSEKLGKVLQIDRVWMTNGHEDRMIRTPDFWCHDLPGGRWTETVPHDLYVAYQFVGPMQVLDVQPRKRTETWPWMQSDELLVTLAADAAFVSFRYSANLDHRFASYLTVHGSKGAVMVDAFSKKVGLPVRTPGQPSLLRHAAKTARTGLSRVKQGLSVSNRPPSQNGADPLSISRQSGHLALIEQFTAYVRGEGPEPVSWEEAYHTMALTDEIGRRSAAAMIGDNPIRRTGV